jgi:hypothetical protein
LTTTDDVLRYSSEAGKRKTAPPEAIEPVSKSKRKTAPPKAPPRTSGRLGKGFSFSESEENTIVRIGGDRAMLKANIIKVVGILLSDPRIDYQAKLRGLLTRHVAKL